jgi:hypothetical protein
MRNPVVGEHVIYRKRSYVITSIARSEATCEPLSGCVTSKRLSTIGMRWDDDARAWRY